MRPESRFETIDDRVAALEDAFGDASAEIALRAAFELAPGRVAVVSSFGAESVVLLHMVSRLDPAAPILFLDTEMLFPATIAYQEKVARHLGLRDVRRIRPGRDALFRTAPEGDLHRRDPDLCCRLRKTVPLEAALAPFGAWITGRKRHQSGVRAGLATFETDSGDRIKVNPLARWSRTDIATYMDRHDLPRHPLVARGFLSIGCAPCTTPVGPGEDDRAGRWRGSAKTECGIHLKDGRYVRASAEDTAQ